MKPLTKLLFIIFFFLVTVAIYSQEKDYSKEPGYINFGDLASLEADDSGTEVLLEEHLLKMVAKMTKKEDADLSALINGLKLVKVNQFKVGAQNESKVDNRISSLDKELMSKGWDRIIKTKNKGETANVYIKTVSGDKIGGLVVLSYNHKNEAAFVNIVGDINLESIGGLTEKFDIPELKDIPGKRKK